MVALTAFRHFLAVTLCIFICVRTVAASPLTLTFFDVGEGDATLIENRNDGCFERLLIDTGNFWTGAELSERLRALRRSPLSWLILTHPHPDHIGGVFAFLAQHQVEKLADNGQPLDEASKQDPTLRWYTQAVRSDSRYRTLRASSTNLLTCGGQLRVLAPAKGALNADWNHNSLILFLERDTFRALFMGDALTATSEALTSHPVLKNPVTLVKAGHHASRHSLSRAFMSAARPKTTIVSVGTPNPYGYPSEETLAAYSAYGTVLRTDRVGDIVVDVDGKGVHTIRHAR